MTINNNVEYSLVIFKPEISNLSKEEQENFKNDFNQIITTKSLTIEENEVYPDGISETQAKTHSYKTLEWKKKVGGYIKEDYPNLTDRRTNEEIGKKVYQNLVEYFQNKKITCFVIKGENAQKIFVTFSLAAPHEEWSSKLVAGIMIAENTKNQNTPRVKGDLPF